MSTIASRPTPSFPRTPLVIGLTALGVVAVSAVAVPRITGSTSTGSSTQSSVTQSVEAPTGGGRVPHAVRGPLPSDLAAPITTVPRAVQHGRLASDVPAPVTKPGLPVPSDPYTYSPSDPAYAAALKSHYSSMATQGSTTPAAARLRGAN